MRLTRNLKLFPAFFAVLALLTGCSDKVSLQGRVTFADNGEPVDKGMILFVSGSFQARGNIDQNGNYVAGTISARDGIPKGEYRVTVVGVTKTEPFGQGSDAATGTGRTAPATTVDSSRLTPGQSVMADTIQTPLVHTKYLQSGTTDIVVTVDGSKKVHDIRLERYEY